MKLVLLMRKYGSSGTLGLGNKALFLLRSRLYHLFLHPPYPVSYFLSALCGAPGGDMKVIRQFITSEE